MKKIKDTINTIPECYFIDSTSTVWKVNGENSKSVVLPKFNFALRESFFSFDGIKIKETDLFKIFSTVNPE